MTHTKVCPKCLMKKSLDKFKPRSDGSFSYCYECLIQYYKTYNAGRYATPEAREVERQRSLTRYQSTFKPARIARKQKLIEIFGGKCYSCGYNKSSAALDFHHREPTQKTRTVSHLLAVNQAWAWPEVLIEASKCDLVCSNCHRECTYPGHSLSQIVSPISLSKHRSPCTKVLKERAVRTLSLRTLES